MAHLPVYFQGNARLRNTGHMGCRGNRANRRGVFKAFANTPGAALLFHVVLQVAARHVQAHGVAKNMAVRISGLDVVAAHANGDD